MRGRNPSLHSAPCPPPFPSKASLRRVRCCATPLRCCRGPTECWSLACTHTLQVSDYVLSASNIHCKSCLSLEPSLHTYVAGERSFCMRYVNTTSTANGAGRPACTHTQRVSVPCAGSTLTLLDARPVAGPSRTRSFIVLTGPHLLASTCKAMCSILLPPLLPPAQPSLLSYPKA